MITVPNCGHDSHHHKPCNIEHRQGLSDYLLLLIKQDAWIELHGTIEHVPSNSAICFSPGSYIHYGCDKSGYNDDWVHFLPSLEDDGLYERLHLPLNTLFYPHDFHRLSEYVKLLSEAFHNKTPHQSIIIDSLMHAFLYTLKEELPIPTGQKAPHKFYSDFAALRTGIYNDPAKAYSLPLLADNLALSLSYFQHLYKEFFGCSCGQDIIQARLKLAQYYLRNSDMSIHGIADFCGYENDTHFMRQFKQLTGITPSEYRSRF